MYQAAKKSLIFLFSIDIEFDWYTKEIKLGNKVIINNFFMQIFDTAHDPIIFLPLFLNLLNIGP